MLGSVEKSFVAFMYAGALISSVSAETIRVRFKPSTYLSVACEESSMSLPLLMRSRSISSVTAVMPSSSAQVGCSIITVRSVNINHCEVTRSDSFVNTEGVLVEDPLQCPAFEVEICYSLGIGSRGRHTGPVGAEDHLGGEALEVEVPVVIGELMWGESGDLDPDVGAHERDKGCGFVPPAAPAVGEDYGEVGEVADDVLDQGRVGVAVRRTREDTRAAVEDYGEAFPFAVGVGRVEHTVVGGEGPMDGMDLESDRAELDLALQLVYQREVQVRVEVRHEVEAFGVMGEERDQVLHGLYACGLRAVLAEKNCDVHALALHVVVETLRDESAFLIVELEQRRRAVLGCPLPPGLFQGRETRGVDVSVYQRDPVQQAGTQSTASTGTTTGLARRPSRCPAPPLCTSLRGRTSRRDAASSRAPASSVCERPKLPEGARALSLRR